MPITESFNDDIQQITVTLPGKNRDGVIEYEVEAPTPEQLFLLATETNSARAVMGFIGNLFEPSDYADIRRRLGLRRGDPDRLLVEDLTALVEALMEAESGGFPTESASDSSPSQTPTGRRSTGRVRSAPSTPSRSVSAVS